jgi:hypothetical protein
MDPSKPASLHTDYERINDVLQEAQPVIVMMIYNYYDPSFAPSAANTMVNEEVLDLLVQWRDEAWGNGYSLYYNPSELNRSVIEDEAAANASQYTTPNTPDPRATRLEYCETHPTF